MHNPLVKARKSWDHELMATEEIQPRIVDYGRRRGGRNIGTLAYNRVGGSPHSLSTQNVAHLLIWAGVARPFVEPGLSGDDEGAGTRG